MAEGKELAVCVGLTKLSTEDMYVNFIVINCHIDFLSNTQCNNQQRSRY